MLKLRQEEIYKGAMLHIVRNAYRADNGAEVTRELVLHPGAAVIVPMIGQEEVLMVEQFRPGAGRKLLEFPAGCLDPDEDPRTCAARELREETGYSAQTLENIFNIYPTPGISSEQLYVFIATGLTHEGEQQLDGDEYMTVQRRNFRDLRVQLRSGNIKNGSTLAALCYLFAFKPYLGQDAAQAPPITGNP